MYIFNKVKKLRSKNTRYCNIKIILNSALIIKNQIAIEKSAKSIPNTRPDCSLPIFGKI